MPATRKSTTKPKKKSSSTTRGTKEVQVLHRILETISYNLHLDDILEEIIRVVDSVAHADEIFVYLLKEDELVLRAAKQQSHDALGSIRLQVGTGITGWVAEHRTPVRLSKKAYEDKRFYLFTNLKADQYEAFLSLPMIYHDKLIGVVNVQHREHYICSEREMKLLQTIAYATAGAIENARLFEQTNVLTEALEARKIIEKAKGRLMKQHGISEEEAYKWMKKRAMDVRKTMREIADAVLMTDFS